MKERPILFSTEMVRAILDGRKTQTRRVIKKEYQRHYSDSPYGIPGDKLWVRESWKIIGWNDGEPFFIQYKDGKTKSDVMLPEDKCEDYWIQCSEDCIKSGLKTNDDDFFVIDGDVPTRWRPSIFMPREASRINLEITNIRVERLNDISEVDAKQEGIQIPVSPDKKYLVELTGKYPTCNYFKVEEKNYFQACFASLWDSINAKRGFEWNKNPWVWVIEFNRINK